MSRRFRLPFRSRASIAADVDEELRFHLATVAERLRADGWPAHDADAEARRRFGDLESTTTYCRAEDARREQQQSVTTVAHELLQDMTYALRGLRTTPGFTFIALVTLALGIGANTAIFSVVRGVLLSPLPFASPGEVVRVGTTNHAAGITEGTFSEPDFIDLRATSKLAASIGGFFWDGQVGVDLTGGGAPERLSAALVTPGFFETLRARPAVGRVLANDEHEAGRNRFVVIGHGLWLRRFGGDSRVVGRTITLNGEPFTVVGVMGPQFSYPATQTLDAWIPLSYFGPDAIGRERGKHFVSAIARLRAGVSPEQFRSEVAGIVARLSAAYPDNRGWSGATVRSIRESITDDVERPLTVLLVAVALVLLITCVNLASLLVARASARQRELAVRAALGAGRGRIVRQLLTESLLLSLMGGALGAVVGYAAVRALAGAGGAGLPGALDIHVDGVALAFTLGISVAAGLFFGTVPAVRATGPAMEQRLRAGRRGSVGGQGQRLRNGLVVAEVALAVILAVSATLATKSFTRLLAIDPGFRAANALVARISVPDAYSTDERRAVYVEQLFQAIREIPGVTAVGSIKDLPTRGNGEMVQAAQLGLRGSRASDGASLQLHHVSPGFFNAMGVPVLGGRELEWTDGRNAPAVFVVNETAARQFWPGESAVGKIVHAGKQAIQIVGVVGDIRQRGLGEPVDPAIYISTLQNPRSGMSIVVRTSGEPLAAANAVRRAIWSVNRTQTIAEVTTLDDVLGSAVARPKLLAWLLGAFGFLGLLLGALGIYGMLAFAVTQRRQEIGVRAALGAPRRAVLGLVMGQAALLAFGGVIIGTLAASVLTRQMRAVLFGIAPTDTLTFAQVIVVLIGTAMLASWLPARRALAIDPVTALRFD